MQSCEAQECVVRCNVLARMRASTHTTHIALDMSDGIACSWPQVMMTIARIKNNCYDNSTNNDRTATTITKGHGNVTVPEPTPTGPHFVRGRRGHMGGLAGPFWRYRSNDTAVECRRVQGLCLGLVGLQCRPCQAHPKETSAGTKSCRAGGQRFEGGPFAAQCAYS